MPAKKGIARRFRCLKQLFESIVEIPQRIRHFWQRYMIIYQLHIEKWKDSKMLLAYAKKVWTYAEIFTEKGVWTVH